ncbi:MAG: hypothetical protein QOC62_6007 [Mycobacterium sp.]|jgi:hypothetical protein|nr:hypothetical protein [Mycobacterium sp.]
MRRGSRPACRRRARATPIWRAGIALLIGPVVVLAFPGSASADATTDHPNSAPGDRDHVHV